MPLGDPHGGNFIYTDEGIPSGIALVSVPSRDVPRAVRFYCGLLRMEEIRQSADEALLSFGNDLMLITRSDAAGIDTGLYLGTDSVYDLHRRLVDEGVVFVLDPVRTHLGLETSFMDDDGNLIHAIEIRRKG